MEERIASPVGRIDAPPKFVPVADLVHRLVADDLFQKRCRRGPVDAAQHQKAAIEPRTEQMQKIAIDDGERRVLLHELEQVRAHRDQRGGAARRAIEPPEQLVTTRLGGIVDFARRRFVAVRLELGDRVPHPIAIRPEIVGERAEERRMIARIERAIAPNDLGGERDPRRLAPPFDQSSAVLDQLFDAVIRILWPRLDLEHGAAALGDRGQKIVEEGVAHDFPSALSAGQRSDETYCRAGAEANQVRVRDFDDAMRRIANGHAAVRLNRDCGVDDAPRRADSVSASVLSRRLPTAASIAWA